MFILPEDIEKNRILKNEKVSLKELILSFADYNMTK